MRSKFNTALEDVLSDKSGHYIMDVNSRLNDSTFFTCDNELKGEGRVLFWQEVDAAIKEFDVNKLKLLPIHSSRPSTQNHTSYSANHFRLPPPLVQESHSHSYARDRDSRVHSSHLSSSKHRDVFCSGNQRFDTNKSHNKVWINQKYRN